jgi:chemotaxis protein MotB
VTRSASAYSFLRTFLRTPRRIRPNVHILLVLCVAASSGCVSQAVYNEVSKEKDDLAAELARTQIERDSLEQQYYEAQESYEDERVTRTSLASDLEQTAQLASKLDRSLAAERDARIAAATALAAREAELARIQSTYDELVTDLESEVSSGQIEIQRLREGLRLNVSDDVLFATGSADLDRIGRDVLIKVAGQLKTLKDFIEVRGHSDNRKIGGSLAKRYPSNWELAAARAARVVRLLEANGVPGDRLAAVSLGPNQPVAANDTAENRARNRRIEIRLLPHGGPDKAADEASKDQPEGEAKTQSDSNAAAGPRRQLVEANPSAESNAPQKTSPAAPTP